MPRAQGCAGAAQRVSAPASGLAQEARAPGFERSRDSAAKKQPEFSASARTRRCGPWLLEAAVSRQGRQICHSRKHVSEYSRTAGVKREGQDTPEQTQLYAVIEGQDKRGRLAFRLELPQVLLKFIDAALNASASIRRLGLGRSGALCGDFRRRRPLP